MSLTKLTIHFSSKRSTEKPVDPSRHAFKTTSTTQHHVQLPFSMDAASRITSKTSSASSSSSSSGGRAEMLDEDDMAWGSQSRRNKQESSVWLP
ncbi:uncharacterized protein C8Q71DRAFT_857799 [Rhodofomes roseus]|uniref:Uncharacterized protein n=1 Tax=Rhodofomes roseus TaxID=34475 RepID=A0ABQ8KFX9_9APHY|nr:uncharacterized protein C8Q71DRAFT_857799 [Rhodofomes roseus]KAH9836570.1 hypothetical protein C8Q71DRAFT_857799 [Rhodofomes roseus]